MAYSYRYLLFISGDLEVAQGRAEGRAEGERVKALEIARKMKSRGASLADIMDFTGLSEDDILGL